MLRSCLLLLLVYVSPLSAMTRCDTHGVWLQVLGSGGPEINDGRASTAYLIWRDGKARILVDAGSGSMLRFEQTGANFDDLDVILLTHLHVDHTADLPSFIKASFFTDRERALPVFGPTGNRLMPSTVEFVRDLFGPQGAYRYLSGYLDGNESYRLEAHDVIADGKKQQSVMVSQDYRITAVPVHHGPIPALAYRVEIGKYVIVFSGDMNNDYHTLAGLAMGADLLVAHHAIPEQADRVARNLHMPPSVIGDIAAKAAVKKLLLSHRMQRTLGHEGESLDLIKVHYRGPVLFADDLQCVSP